ncbi:MAG TPA: pyruvate carboxylase, partial [Myxococcales bacterium]|nr:pyruvate carboxylase [Myxococcales bacterium]
QVLRGREPIDGRPGETLDALDFDALRADLESEHEGVSIRDVDVMSAALYPKVWRDYRAHRSQFGDVSVLPTRYFLSSLEIGEEITVDIEKGKTLVITLDAVGDIDEKGYRSVFFELNGQPR